MGEAAKPSDDKSMEVEEDVAVAESFIRREEKKVVFCVPRPGRIVGHKGQKIPGLLLRGAQGARTCAARICAEIKLVAQICANLRDRLFRIYALSFARIIRSHLRTIANNRYHAARIKANSINATQRVTRLKA